jgi:hypothetical protein
MFSVLCSPFTVRLLAQSDADVLKTIKEPGFAQWVVYLLIFLIVVDRAKAWVTPARREVSGEVITSPKPQVASKEDVDKLRAEFSSFQEITHAEHQSAIVAGQNRVAALSEVLNGETDELEHRLDALRESLFEKIDHITATLSAKIDPLVIACANHSTLLPRLERDIEAEKRERLDSISKIHNRVNDAISLASSAASVSAAKK